MEDFLARIGLQSKIMQLKQQGFDDMATLGLADKDDLIRAGLGVGHALKLLKSINDQPQTSQAQSTQQLQEPRETACGTNCDELPNFPSSPDSLRDKPRQNPADVELDSRAANETKSTVEVSAVRDISSISSPHAQAVNVRNPMPHEQSKLQHARMSCRAVSIALEQADFRAVSLIEGISFDSKTNINTSSLKRLQRGPLPIVLVCMLSRKSAIARSLSEFSAVRQPIIVLCVDEGECHDTKKVRAAQSMFRQLGASDMVLQRTSGDLRLELEMKVKAAGAALPRDDKRHHALRRVGDQRLNPLVSVEHEKGKEDAQSSEDKGQARQTPLTFSKFSPSVEKCLGSLDDANEMKSRETSEEKGQARQAPLALLSFTPSEEKDLGSEDEAEDMVSRASWRGSFLTNMHVPLSDSSEFPQSSASQSSQSNSNSSFIHGCRDIATIEMHRHKCFKLDHAANVILCETLAKLGYPPDTRLERLVYVLESRGIIHLIQRLPNDVPQSHLIIFMEALSTLMENLPHLHLNLPKECTWANRKRPQAPRRGRPSATPSTSTSSTGAIPGSHETSNSPAAARVRPRWADLGETENEDLQEERQLDWLFSMLDLNKCGLLNFDQIRVVYLTARNQHDLPEATLAPFANEDGLINRAGFGNLIVSLQAATNCSIQNLCDACQ